MGLMGLKGLMGLMGLMGLRSGTSKVLSASAGYDKQSLRLDAFITSHRSTMFPFLKLLAEWRTRQSIQDAASLSNALLKVCCTPFVKYRTSTSFCKVPLLFDFFNLVVVAKSLSLKSCFLLREVLVSLSRLL